MRWVGSALSSMGELAMGSIVLADDDDDLRAVYGPFLRSLGHHVREATSGLEALEQIRRDCPGLLILDVWMPRCNGFEVLEQLRREPIANRLKVLMLSNMGDADTRLECFEMGVADYVVKGLALGELGDRVNQLLAGTDDEADLEPTPTDEPDRPPVG